jgi:energy-coupling factor transporter transmembrane protein EcfT
MSNDVYAAMMARGFSGEIRAYSTYRMTTRDWLALVAALAIAVGAVLAGRLLPS